MTNLAVYDILPAVMKALAEIGKGRSITHACADVDLPVSTFRKYVRENADLATLFEEMTQQGFDALADALLDPAGHHMYGTTDPKAQKVISDNIKWLLGRRAPDKFGDRVTVRHEITADKVITQMLNEGMARAHGEIVDAAYTVIEEKPAAVTPPASPVSDPLAALLDHLR